MPGGDGDNQITWELTGHLWQEEPYTNDSTKIGYNPKSLSYGSLTGYGVTSVYDIVLDSTPGTTPSGDAYTFKEFERMFRNAGFSRSEIHPLFASPEQAIISYK